MKEEVIERFMRDQEHKAKSLYNSGYSDGKESAESRTYEDGLKDAWELAKKAVWDTSTCELRALGFNIVSDESEILKQDFNAVREALKRGANIHVGDEVIDTDGNRAVVTNTDTHYHLLYISNGETWKAPKSTALKKTGNRIVIPIE